MENSLRNIKNLTKVFIKDSAPNLNIIKNKKINKKSYMFWIIMILELLLAYLSQEIIKYLLKRNMQNIFLEFFLLLIEIIIIIQIIMICMNIFYFSKNIEHVLPLPFKPYELMIAKFNTLISFIWGIETIFGAIPLIIYGIYTSMGFLYYIKLLLSFIFLPIFPALIITLIVMLFMKYIKFIKNKDLMQIILSFALITVFIFGLYLQIKNVINFENQDNIKQEEVISTIENKINVINKFFITLNPEINLLKESKFFENLFRFIYLIFINLALFFILIFIGSKIYLKQLLETNFYYKNKKNKQINLNKKIKKGKINVSYLKKEFKNIIKNPLFFVKNIYTVLIYTITISILLIILIPQVRKIGNEQNLFEGISFDIEACCIIVGLTQVIGLFNNMSITAISREGKNAYIMKYLPIDLYKQFIYKNIPQILTNTISSIVIISSIFFRIPEIGIKYIILLNIISFLFNCINSFILVIINLFFPKNQWDAEYEIFRNNKNLLIQYVLIIFNILILVYIKKIFIDFNLDKSIISIIMALLIIFIVINLIVNKFKTKLFKKIN